MNKDKIFQEVEGLYRIIPLVAFRQTPQVTFDFVPAEIFPHIDGLDRVIHSDEAQSPQSVGDVKCPWYMHTHQDDYLIVLQGERISDLFSVQHGKVESFKVSPHTIEKDGVVIYAGPAILSWPRHVFHRVKTCPGGSASLNVAVRYDNYDVKTNFNIYDLDVKSGEFRVIREGHLDQQ